MAENKFCRKKLTESGGGICFLAFLSLLVSVMGLIMEFLGTLGYNRYSDVEQNYVFASNLSDYIFTYEKSIITAVISLITFFVFLAYRKKKKIGADFSMMLIFSSLVCAIKPLAFLVYVFNDSEFLELFSESGDSRTFLAIMTVLIHALPLISCLFLLICGLVIALKLIREDFRAEVPVLTFEKPVVESIEKPDYEVKNNNYPQQSDEAPTNAVAVSADITPEQSERKCPACGAKLKPDAKFCQLCGEKIV